MKEKLRDTRWDRLQMKKKNKWW